MKYFKILVILLVWQPLAAITYWKNWGNTQQCMPQQIFYPETLADVQHILHTSNQEKIAVKAIGSSHSWSDLVCTDGYLINTDHLNNILWIDREKAQVKVQAGIKLKDLAKKLADVGLALGNQGFITEQSLAGAIATATHGTGKAYNLSDYIVAMEIIDACGTVHEVSENHNSGWLPLLRVHLGALGFIYSITIQCEPLFNLKHQRFLVDLDKILDFYHTWYQENDFFMFMVNAYSQQAVIFIWNRTEEPVTAKPWHYVLNDCIFHKILNYAAIETFNRLPSISSFCIERGLSLLQMKEHVEYSYISLSPIKAPLPVTGYIEEEIAIPFEYFAQAFYALRQLYDEYTAHNINLKSIITCRFGPASDRSYLSPCYGRKTAYITINIINYFDEYEQFFKDFEQIMRPFGGRPHWGKFHYLTKQTIAGLYDNDHLAAFTALKNQLDPDGLFTNQFIHRCFE